MIFGVALSPVDQQGERCGAFHRHGAISSDAQIGATLTPSAVTGRSSCNLWTF
jgi:hypothetical protein